MLQRDSSNLEDYVTYTWASLTLVRDGVYEVVFGETLMLSPGSVQFVYFSAGGKDILGCSPLLTVRSNINIARYKINQFVAEVLPGSVVEK